MIKLVQGFTVGSPLPIDSRITLSKEEMRTNKFNDPDTGRLIDLDNILPDHYFAFCSDPEDNRLYLYDKSIRDLKDDDETCEYGKFVLADKQVIDKINKLDSDINLKVDTINEELNRKIDADKADLEDLIDFTKNELQHNIDDVNSSLLDEVDRASAAEGAINLRLTNEVTRIDGEIADLREKDESFDEKFVEVDASLLSLSGRINDNLNKITSEEAERKEEDNLIRQALIVEQANREAADNNILFRVNRDRQDFDDYVASNNATTKELDERLDSAEARLDVLEADVDTLYDEDTRIEEKLDDTIEDLNDYKTENDNFTGDLDNRLSNIEEELHGDSSEPGISQQVYDLQDDVEANREDFDTYVEQNDVRVSKIEDDVRAIDEAIDTTVITSLEPFEIAPDKIVITHNNLNIKTGQTSFEQENLPLANTQNAGLMSPSDVNAISTLRAKVASMEGGTTRLLYLTEEDIVNNTFTVSYVDVVIESDGSRIETRYHVTYTMHDIHDMSKMYITPDAASKQYGTEFRSSGVPEPDGSYKFTIYEIASGVDPIDYFVTREVVREVKEDQYFVRRQTPTTTDEDAEIVRLKGNSTVFSQIAGPISSEFYSAAYSTVEWNQPINNAAVCTATSDGTPVFGIYLKSDYRHAVAGHKYLTIAVVKSSKEGNVRLGLSSNYVVQQVPADSYVTISALQTAIADHDTIAVYKQDDINVGDTLEINKLMCIDLTLLNDSRITDFDSFRTYYFYDNYSYTPRHIISFNPQFLDSSFEGQSISTLTLPWTRFFQWGMNSIGNVYDEMTSTQAIRRIGVRQYQQGDENDNSVLTDMEKTLYVLDEEVVTDIDPEVSLIYEVKVGGVEELLPNNYGPYTTPMLADIGYPISNLYIKRKVNIESINSFALGQGYEPPFNGLAVVASDTEHVWRYYQNEDAGAVIGWVDEGVDTVTQFTNESFGIIKGAGEKEGHIYAEADGTGSVFGWTALTDVVSNSASSIASLEEYSATKQELNTAINELKDELISGIEEDIAEIQVDLSKKVDKETNKSLISTSEIQRLESIASQANRVSKGTANGDLKVVTRLNGSESTTDINIYTHPEGTSAGTQSGFYKFETDSTSHIKSVSNVAVSDITDLNPYDVAEGLSLSKNASTGVVTLSTKKLATAVLDTASWQASSGNFYYTQEIQLPGVTDDSEPIIDISTANVLNQTDLVSLYTSWSYVFRAEASEGKIKFYSSAVPTVNINVLIKGF